MATILSGPRRVVVFAKHDRFEKSDNTFKMKSKENIYDWEKVEQSKMNGDDDADDDYDDKSP